MNKGWQKIQAAFDQSEQTGRRATPDEVRHSIKTGLPALEEMARAQGPAAELELKAATKRAMSLLNV